MGPDGVHGPLGLRGQLYERAAQWGGGVGGREERGDVGAGAYSVGALIVRGEVGVSGEVC